MLIIRTVYEKVKKFFSSYLIFKKARIETLNLKLLILIIRIFSLIINVLYS